MLEAKYHSCDKDKNFLLTWLRWQYIESPRALVKIIGNFLRFNLSFFSIPLLLKTLIYPWRKYHESYGRGFDFKRFFSAFTFNSISRILGAIVRIILILIGGSMELFLLISGLIVFVMWIIYPLLLLMMLILGFYLIL